MVRVVYFYTLEVAGTRSKLREDDMVLPGGTEQETEVAES